MNYSAVYTDESGENHSISINDADSVEAINNDYQVLMKRYNPKFVRIERIQPRVGEAMHLRITTFAPSHYLENPKDIAPKPCNSMVAHIAVYPGYPLKAVTAYYPSDHYLASPNVFRSGNACIDGWIPMTSSLLSVADKLIMDMIHNPNVNRYESPANASLIDWHKKGVLEGRFPTVSPKLVTTVPPPALPSRINRTAAPPLPSRRR